MTKFLLFFFVLSVSVSSFAGSEQHCPYREGTREYNNWMYELSRRLITKAKDDPKTIALRDVNYVSSEYAKAKLKIIKAKILYAHRLIAEHKALNKPDFNEAIKDVMDKYTGSFEGFEIMISSAFFHNVSLAGDNLSTLMKSIKGTRSLVEQAFVDDPKSMVIFLKVLDHYLYKTGSNVRFEDSEFQFFSNESYQKKDIRLQLISKEFDFIEKNIVSMGKSYGYKQSATFEKEINNRRTQRLQKELERL